MPGKGQIKRETRKCSECGTDVTRRPCEFKSEFSFCGRKCSMAHHNRLTAAKKKIIKICAQCGVDFELRKCESFRKFCGQACMGKSKRKIVIRECAQCHGEFVVDRANADGKYCGSGCYNDSRARGTAACVMCGTRYTLSKDKPKTCSPLCMNRLGIQNTPPDVMAAKKKKLQAAGVINFKKLMNKFKGRKDTPIELALQAGLRDAGIPFRTQEPLLEMTVADIYIEPRIVVYCDGMLWHNLPTAIVRDARNNKALAAAGYTVLRFTGKQIRNNLQGCVVKVLNIYRKARIDLKT